MFISFLLLFSHLFYTKMILARKCDFCDSLGSRHRIPSGHHRRQRGIFSSFLSVSFKTYHYSFGIEIKISDVNKNTEENINYVEGIFVFVVEIFISELYHSSNMNILTYFYYLRQKFFFRVCLGQVENQVFNQGKGIKWCHWKCYNMVSEWTLIGLIKVNLGKPSSKP